VPRRPHREESCGGHFREEHQTEEGEALRDDENFAFVARLGVDRAIGRARPPQGAARVRERQADHPELQVNLTSRSGARPARRAGAVRDLRGTGISEDASFLEMLDIVNERLIEEGRSRSRSTTTAARASAAPAG
jgi:hypothetical protein